MNRLTQSVAVAPRARLLQFGALITAALMLSLSSFSASARAAESDPTIVLVHGAFASPAGWERASESRNWEFEVTSRSGRATVLHRET